jgi:hypothetical protein
MEAGQQGDCSNVTHIFFYRGYWTLAFIGALSDSSPSFSTESMINLGITVFGW